jgi:hypothetical protein
MDLNCAGKKQRQTVDVLIGEHKTTIEKKNAPSISTIPISPIPTIATVTSVSSIRIRAAIWGIR